jgi:hypothetical protein
VVGTEDTTKFFGSFQKLRKLDLSDCRFATSEQLIGVLGPIPSLEDLRLDRVKIRRKWDPSIDDQFDTVRLEAGRYPREAFDPSSYGSTPSRLHTLVFSDAFAMREGFTVVSQGRSSTANPDIGTARPPNRRFTACC